MKNQLYNYKLLKARQERLDKTPEQLAKAAGISIVSVNTGLAGNLRTMTTLRSLTDALGIDWEYVTRISLPEDEFHRAVLKGRPNGDQRGGRP